MLSTKKYIEKLAKDNNICYYPNSLDDFARKISELSDNDLEQDPILDLVIALFRNNIINKTEMLSLSHKYLKEKNLKKDVSKKENL